MTSEDLGAGAPPPQWSGTTGEPGAPAGAGIPLAPPTAKARSNGFAIAALILGIVWLCGFGSLLAVVFGHVSLTQIARSEGWEKGRGMALAGLILGYCGLALIVFAIIASATSYKP
jgi:Domain of unknown function (DUF4190)